MNLEKIQLYNKKGEILYKAGKGTEEKQRNGFSQLGIQTQKMKKVFTESERKL